MNNPYHAPSADLRQAHDEDQGYLPTLMSASGRIGRVRYLAYTVLPSLGVLFAGGILLVLLLPQFRGNPVLSLLCYIPVFILLFVMGARRLNDLNLSGWLSLLSLIPIINLLFGLALLFIPGNERSNRYGPAPQKNTPGVKALAWLGAILMFLIIAMLAAVAYPAYQGYVDKSKAAARTTSQPAPDAQQGDE